MSISSLVCKRTYQADGTTRSWELDFPVLSAQDVAVYVTNANGIEEKITTGYEVNLQEHYVVYPTLASGLDALGAGCKITLLRTTPLTQEITLTQQGVLDAQELEGGYDKLTLQVQELAEQVSRSIKYAVSSGKSGADAQAFLNELAATQSTALSGALASVAQTQSTLQQAQSTEATARQQADTALQQSVQNLAGVVAQKDAAQTAALEAEASARSAADTDAQSSLNAEISARQTADSALDSAKLSKTEAQNTYVALSQKAAANGVATLDSNTLIPSVQLPAATTSTQGAVAVDSGLNSSSTNPVQNKEIFARLSLLTPYIQQYAVSHFNTQTEVNANDLLAATAALHAFSLNLSPDTSLTKLTAAGTSAAPYTGLEGVLVSDQAPFNNATAPQLDVSYTGLNCTALVNLFNSMPYNVGYTLVGSPTIADGIVTGADGSNYLLPTSNFKFAGNEVEIIGKAVGVVRLVDDYGHITVGFTSARRFYVSLSGNQNLGPTKTEGEDYFRFHKTADGSVTTLSVGTSLTNWTQTITFDNLSYPDNNTPHIVDYTASESWADLNEFKIKINGKRWSAFDGITRRCSVVGCTGTADLTAADKAIAEDKGWEITLS